MSKPHKSQKSARKALRVAIIAVAATIASTAAPQAFGDPNLKPHIDHLIECVGWLISDPETHAANCLPNRVPDVVYKEDSDPFVPPAAVPAPAPVPVPPAPTGSSV